MGADLAAIFGSVEDTSLPGVALSSELRRVLDIPLRDPIPLAERLVDPLTRRLRTPSGTMTLRPLQALALVEAHDFGGLLGLLPVGEGKTLLSFLLPLVLGKPRPLLIVPAALEEKTEIEFAELREHWQYVPMPITSYELISRRPELLDELAPDMIVCDEVHALKSPKSACTKRVYRYLRKRAKARKATTFCGLSGTIAARSFRDWWHLQQWALKPELQPLPYDFPTCLSWCEALDEKLGTRRPLGDLSRFCVDFTPNDVLLEPEPKHVRTAFGKRLRMIPSIVSSQGGEVKASIRVNVKLGSVPVIDQAVSKMRKTWATPGGEEFTEAADLWRHARELANGFYYRWQPMPPLEWLDARSEFMKLVRQVLHGSRTFDTMAQVRDAYASDPRVRHWQAIEPTFEPNTVPVWLTDDVLEYAQAWGQQRGGLVWVEHCAVGERLEDDFGLPYFRAQGRTRDGASIMHHTGPAAVSQAAVSRGFNLQRYDQNLVLNATPIGTRYEQLFGRTHRQGQDADVVTFDILVTVAEQLAGFEQARLDAAYEQQTTGQKQKLCLADVTQTGALRA